MKNSNGMMIRSLVMTVLVSSGMNTAFAFTSGSTGSDGAFSPTVNTQLQLPPDGIFNFTTVNIPSGVTVTFQKNTTNTPVTILASGDVTIAGTLDLSGTAAANVGAAGDGNIGDDGLPGLGGPGGFDGGRGGIAGSNAPGSSGIGPGGAGPARGLDGTTPCGGAGGSYGSSGGLRTTSRFSTCGPTRGGTAILASTYGSGSLLPLIGGSGGSGGFPGSAFGGGGGGGGGGAILIAASGTVNIAGTIRANGGNGASIGGGGSGGAGGAGSGGAIRIIATSITGNGAVTAAGAAQGISVINGASNGGPGGSGRIRFEADNYTRTAATTPAFSFAAPQEVFIAGLPALRITTVAGVAAPATPTGNADITLPQTTANPVTVEFATSGVPVGNTVTLSVTPASGSNTSVVSTALTGTVDNATANVSVTLPSGPSILSASVSYTVTASVGNALSTFAKGETVERIVLAAVPGALSETTLITTSGKQYTYTGRIPAIY
ncbi:hypothetical protein [Sulfuriflexus mobilis]|uniref:hypothetical protein n=1 Tax=Sulfuriflexus mobilis TaxID=1811807 RepID=UPI000F84CFE2|nr:hypothetical protein [Sulfuriflexus mobilis]